MSLTDLKYCREKCDQLRAERDRLREAVEGVKKLVAVRGYTPKVFDPYILGSDILAALTPPEKEGETHDDD